MHSLIRPLLLATLTLTALLPGVTRLARALPAPAPIVFGGSIGLAYNPSRLVIHAGETVQWQGSFSAHPLISDEELWPEQDAGTKFTFTFNTPGTFRYHCGRHGMMQGTVVVEPAN